MKWKCEHDNGRQAAHVKCCPSVRIQDNVQWRCYQMMHLIMAEIPDKIAAPKRLVFELTTTRMVYSSIHYQSQSIGDVWVAITWQPIEGFAEYNISLKKKKKQLAKKEWWGKAMVKGKKKAWETILVARNRGGRHSLESQNLGCSVALCNLCNCRWPQ